MITNINKAIFDFKGIDHEQDSVFINNTESAVFNSPDVQQFFKLLGIPEVQTVLQLHIENILATSELHILKRLSAIEQALGLTDDLDEEIQTLPERLEKLEAHVFTEEPTQKTQMEKRAEFFLKAPPVGESTPSREKVIKSKVFRQWLAKLPDDIKPKSLLNLRKLKIDFFKFIGKMYPDRAYTKQDHDGNREWKLILKSVT